MTTTTIYMRRHGNMMFWRVGRIGGSFYLAKSAVVDHGAKEARKAARKERMQALRQQAKWTMYWRQQAIARGA